MTKKLLSLILMCFVALGALADEYTYTFTSKQFSEDGTVTLNDVDWTLATTWHKTGTYYGYANNTNSTLGGLQIGSKNAPANKVTLSTSGISGTVSSVTVNAGAYSSDAKIVVSVNGTAYGDSVNLKNSNADYTFTGSASGEIEISLTNPSTGRALYIKSITVTYTAGGGTTTTVAAPTFTPAAGTYSEAQTVTIAADGAGAIYYTNDGTDPSTSTTAVEYTAPITASESVTLKAVALSADGNTFSDVTTAEYVIKSQTTTYETVTLPYNDLSSSIGKFQAEDVTNDTGKDLWSWNSSYKYVQAKAYISSTNYATETNLVSPIIDLTTAIKPELVFAHAGKFFATPLSDYAKLLVRLEGATEWTEITIDNYFNNSSWTFVNDTVDLSAYVGKKIQLAFGYRSTTSAAGTWEIKNVSVTDEGVAATEVATLAEANALTDATEFSFTGKAVVAYQNGYYLFVQDASGAGLIYGKVDTTFTQGQVLNAGWTATKTTYNGLTEYASPASVTASEETATVTPTVLAESDIVAEKQNCYVQLKNVAITVASSSSAPALKATTTKNFTIGEALAGYNKFGIDIPEDATKKYDITGFVSVHNSTVQLMPIQIVESTNTGVSDVNAAKQVQSVRYYNLAGQQSAEPFEGVNVVKTVYTDGTTSVAKTVK